MFCTRFVIQCSLQERANISRFVCTTVNKRNICSPDKSYMNLKSPLRQRQILPPLKKHTIGGTTTDKMRRLSISWSELFYTSKHKFCTDVKSDDINIDYNQMTTLVKEDNTHVIDVREIEEIEAFGEVPGAVNIPMGELEEALEMPPHKYRALYHTEPPDPDNSAIIFICSKGIRSYAAVNIAKELGFQKSWHFGRGYGHWKKCRDGKDK